MLTTDTHTALQRRPLEEPHCGFSDFDFLLGSWRVRHRQLRRLLSHSNNWHDFVGRSEVCKILGGFGLMEEHIVFEPHGTYRAMSLLTFDIASNRWSIWRYDGRLPTRLEPALQGIFDGEVGVFFGTSVLEGDPVEVRHVWTMHDSAPHFERAVSTNNGRTWETDWTMEFRRIP